MTGNTMLEMIAELQEQVQLLYNSDANARTEDRLKDIQGYQEIIDTGSDNDGTLFLELKHDAMAGKINIRFTNNLDLVKWMKDNKRWEGRNGCGTTTNANQESGVAASSKNTRRK